MTTRVGKITFDVPQVREGGFYPQSLEKGLRSECALKIALAEMYVQGVSTRKLAADIRAIINAANHHDAETLLAQAVQKYSQKASKLANWMEANIPEGFTMFAFPAAHQRRIRTTNNLERLNREIRRRSRAAMLFPNEASCLRLVTAVVMEISDDWQTGRTYIRLDNL